MANLTTTDAVIIELFDNPLTANPDDRYGRVINVASVNTDTLIKRAIENGFNGNAESMKASDNAIKAEAVKAITHGEIVHYGLGHVILEVEGVFEGNDTQWNPEKHKLVAVITTDKELRELLKTTPTKIIGLAPDKAAIVSVIDVVSGKTNEVLTPSGMVIIKGSRIRIEGDKPGVGLFLTEQASQTATQIPASAIGINDPSKIVFNVPAALAAGDYLMSIVTQFGSNKKQLLNEPRTITLNKVLKVE
jgi:hypothetical protein